MKKKIYLAFATLIVLFGTYYYWENRYVKLEPVIPSEYRRQIIFFRNQMYKIAKPNEVSPDYYKNIKWVLERSHQDYIVKNGTIYVRSKYMNDKELIWNYTLRTTSLMYFEQERKRDSTAKEYQKKIKKKVIR
ncbi:MAG: hypothetical protein ABI892_15685 [Flavobacterium sp.]